MVRVRVRIRVRVGVSLISTILTSSLLVYFT